MGGDSGTIPAADHRQLQQEFRVASQAFNAARRLMSGPATDLVPTQFINGVFQMGFDIAPGTYIDPGNQKDIEGTQSPGRCVDSIGIQPMTPNVANPSIRTGRSSHHRPGRRTGQVVPGRLRQITTPLSP